MKKLMMHGLLAVAVTGLMGCGGKEELGQQDEARQLVMDSIKAHGGKDKWYGGGQLQFRWKYFMQDLGPDAIVDTLQTFDPKTMSVMHEVLGEETIFGMDEGKFWISPTGAKFTPPAQFWALTPIYFVGIPFVFNDENAIFELLPEKMKFAGELFDQVKVTYHAEAGDSPEDYYVLLIHPVTKVTRGTYYIVTSKLVAPDGPGPAKFITLDDLKDVGGVKLAGSHRTFKMENGQIGDQMRRTEVSELKWLPEGAVDLKAR